ncbi:SMC-Scp complex subunit ScpB, partial [Levilactobacillus brevis]|nr:SMC-Scp complex subunit ScpB [Levilactobacillus brevis]
AGRLDDPGRRKLYQTSGYFLNYFGLEQLAELPLLHAAAQPSETTADEATGDLFLQA